jgi:hypothetical protein
MGVAGSLVAGVLKVLLLDVRRPKDGKLKGIFFCWLPSAWCGGYGCCRVLGIGSPAALVTKVTGRNASAA